jgi:hypothetical protein
MDPIKEDFVALYLKYTEKTECPTFFHRWTAVTSLSAFLGRDIHFKHGHFTLYPNLYTMLIGSPGTKKSSAIKIGAKLLKQAGYNTFAAKKTRQEKFLLDLAEQSERLAVKAAGGGDDLGYDILDQNLFGTTDEEDPESYSNKPPAECFIAADEFNNFIGLGNLDFVSILGELWDYEGVYDYKLKNSKSVFIPNPYITILGGNTPTGFAQAFPTESIGQGFFSRLLLVYGEPTGVKYTFPPVPDEDTKQELIALLNKIKETVTGEITMTPAAMELLDSIYKNWEGIDDNRFEHYTNRRLTHLLKLSLVMVASKLRTEIDVADVIEANTLLSFTEHLMPKALGEFGKSKSSDVAQKIMNVLDTTDTPLSFQSLWKVVVQDLDNRNQLVEVLAGLQMAEKIQSVKGNAYLPVKRVREEGVQGSVDWNLLTDNERNMI